MHKKGLDYFKLVPATWRSWCAIDPNLQDFREHERIVLGEFEDLEEVADRQEHNDQGVEDHKWANQLKTYEKGFSIGRKVLINDDTRSLAAVPQKFYRAGARTIAKKVVGYLEDNTATCHDSVVLFHAATHGNLVTTALTANQAGMEALETAYQAIQNQTDSHSGEKIGLTPTTLVVPVALGGIAHALMTTEKLPPTSGSVSIPNRMYGKLKVEVDPFLTSATAWYVACSPNEIPAIEVGFLKGVQVPQLLTLAPQTISIAGGKADPYDFYFEELRYKARYDFGVAVGEWQGIYKSTGAG